MFILAKICVLLNLSENCDFYFKYIAVISSAALTIVFLSGSQTELDVMKITSTNTLVDSWWKDINCSMPFVDPSLEKYICNKYSGCLDFFPLPSVDKNV